MRLKQKHRKEQDYWLYFAQHAIGILPYTVTDEERMEFLRHDALGEAIFETNPIKLGKYWHGVYGAILKDAQSEPWFYGVEIVEDYRDNHIFGLKPLEMWFGKEQVELWLQSAARRAESTENSRGG